MELAEYLSQNQKIVATKCGGAVVIVDTQVPDDTRWQLWRLTDYIVSSVTGGSIWLIKRETKHD